MGSSGGRLRGEFHGHRHPPPIEIYLWSEVERTLFGHLPGTGDELRNKPGREEARIQAVVDVVLAAEDPQPAFGRWYTQRGEGGRNP